MRERAAVAAKVQNKRETQGPARGRGLYKIFSEVEPPAERRLWKEKEKL